MIDLAIGIINERGITGLVNSVVKKVPGNVMGDGVDTDPGKPRRRCE